MNACPVSHASARIEFKRTKESIATASTIDVFPEPWGSVHQEVPTTSTPTHLKRDGGGGGIQFKSVKCFAVITGLALGTVRNLCTATDAETAVGDHSGALQEIVVTA